MKPAHNAEAEASLLCAVLVDNDTLDRVELEPEEFYDPRHREVFAAMLHMRECMNLIDPVTLSDELEKRGRLAPVGGLLFLSGLLQAAGFASAAKNYAGLIREAYRKRRVSLALSELLAESAKPGSTSDEVLSLAVERLSTMAVHQHDETASISQVIRETVADAQKRCETQDGLNGLPTGLRDLDNMLGGLRRGVLHILAGRPSHGKSSVARTWADNANLAGFGVHVFSLEDTRGTYGLRMLADHSRVDLGKLGTMRGVTRGDMDALATAGNKLYRRTNWLVDDSAGLTSSQIGMRIRKHRKANNTAMVVVDYVQLVAEPRARDEKDRVGRAVQALVQIARQEDVAVVALSQLNRNLENREDKRPCLADLRENGELEQAAYSVVTISQMAKYDRDPAESPHAGKGLCRVLKNKNGQTGDVDLAWQAHTATYRDLDWRDSYGTR